jgi:energy-coupling factor transport system ATP-binding protein
LTRISTVFQSPDHQFVTASVFDEIATGLRALHSQDIEQTVHELLDRLGLAHLTRANPFTLSGGEKRRLSVATVLACNPSVIILDEPTFGQDRLTWMAMVEIVQQLRDSGTTIISVTHDQAYIEALGETRIDLGSP